MKKLTQISADLFNKIRGRFESVTIGDENGKVTNIPEDARYFDFAYLVNGVDLGKVSVALDPEAGLSVIVGKDLVQDQMENVQDGWYNFLKELRVFAKKRLMKFEVRDINKSNLNKRDYQFLAQNSNGENTMAESRMYGNDRTSFQKIGKAKIAIKHSAPINLENAGSRTSKISKIFIESPEGEKFRFPYKHLAGARALALHVSEGGHAYDDFGKYITSLSEEMHKIRKLNTYLGRSSVMAETLGQYSDVLKQRVTEVRKELASLQKPAYYAEAVGNFVAAEAIEVPDDVAENWIDQLTIKQFNEELKDVFPYVYKLVSEATTATELGPEDFVAEVAGPDKCWDGYKKAGTQAGTGKNKGKRVNKCVPESTLDSMIEAAVEDMMGQFAEDNDNYVGAVEYHDGTTIYPKIGDTVELFYSDYTDSDDEADHKPNAVGKIVGKGKRDDDTFIIKWKDNTTGNIEQDEFSAVDEFYILNKDRSDPSRIKGRKQGELPMPGGKTNRRNVKDPIGTEDDTDEVKGPDGDEITLEKEKTPIGEFILSYFDRENGTFPKGETAVLTMVEKDYGEQYVEPSARFIQKVESMVAERNQKEAEMSRYPETDRIKALAGL